MAELSTLPDRVLLTRAVETQCEDAFCTLMSRHRPLVWGVCSRMLRNNSDAEDAFQMTFLSLLEQGENIKAADFGAWLYRVAYRAALRVQANRVAVQTDSDSAAIAKSTMDNQVFQAIEQSEKAQLIEEALDTLPDKYREVLILHYCRGISRDDIAAQLKLTPQTVKARLSRGRSALRSRLIRRGVSLAVAASLLSAEQVLAAPPNIESATWQLAKQWLAGEPVDLDMADFSDLPSTEYGMDFLRGLNPKRTLVAVAAAFALFVVFEMGRANGTAQAGNAGSINATDLMPAGGSKFGLLEPQNDFAEATEIVMAGHTAMQQVEPTAAAPPAAETQEPAPQPQAIRQRRQPTTNPFVARPTPPLSQLQQSALAAVRRQGLPDGTWTRASIIGKVSVIVDGSKLRLHLEGNNDTLPVSATIRAEYSIAADGTVYGLVHSVEPTISVVNDESAELAMTAALLNDIPFSMRVHTDSSSVSIKTLNIGTPQSGDKAGDEALAAAAGQFAMYLRGAYHNNPPQPTRQPAYGPSAAQYQYRPTYSPTAYGIQQLPQPSPSSPFAGSPSPVSPFNTVNPNFTQPAPVPALNVAPVNNQRPPQ